MRCPKCGYISFDHLETCLKCNKDISEAAEKVQGSVYRVAAPTFLKFNQSEEEMDSDEVFIVDDDTLADEEIRDPDLDILLDEEEEKEEEGDFQFSLEKDEDEADFASSPEEEEEGIDFQFEDFEEDADLGDEDSPSGIAQAGEREAELPDELEDMSDLEPPALGDTEVEEVSADEGEVISLDDDELQSLAEDSENVDLADLSLSDLDFDEEPAAPAPSAQTKKPAKKGDLGDDFDFELDLGDLKLDDE